MRIPALPNPNDIPIGDPGIGGSVNPTGPATPDSDPTMPDPVTVSPSNIPGEIGAVLGLPKQLSDLFGGSSDSQSKGFSIPKAIGQFMLGAEYTIDKAILVFFTYGVFAALFIMLIWVIVSDKNPVEIIQSGANNAKDALPHIAAAVAE